MISVGMARGAFEYALKYCKSRVVGGKPLIKHSLISAMFADMATEIDALVVGNRLLLREEQHASMLDERQRNEWLARFELD
jgi:alkylation response protein AidB-like acyl-CoA dehydrogenase